MSFFDKLKEEIDSFIDSITDALKEIIGRDKDDDKPTPPVPPAEDDHGEDDPNAIYPPSTVSQSQTFLWKAESETERGAAVLLPARERGFIERIEIFQNGALVKTVNRHITNEKWVNGARPHFFTFKHDWTGPVTVRGTRTDGITKTWEVPNSAVRFETR